MLSQVLRLVPLSEFGRTENPLWAVAEDTGCISSLDQIEDLEPWASILLPLEHLRDFEWYYLSHLPSPDRRRIHLQTFLGDSALKDHFQAFCDSECRIQIWIDRPIRESEKEDLVNLLKKSEQVDLVYIPCWRYQPEEVFATLGEYEISQFIVHLKLKRSQFDAWLNPDELWQRAILLKEKMKVKHFKFQVLYDQIEQIESESLKAFLLAPGKKSFDFFLKNDRPHDYRTQSTFNIISLALGPLLLEHVRLLLTAVAQPSKKNWALYHRNFVSMLNLWKIPVLAKRFYSSLSLWKVPVLSARFYSSLSVWKLPVYYKRALSRIALWRIPVMLNRFLSSLNIIGPLMYGRSITFVRNLYFASRSFVYLYIWRKICYPFQKIYWFSKFQIEKRFLNRKVSRTHE